MNINNNPVPPSGNSRPNAISALPSHMYRMLSSQFNDSVEKRLNGYNDYTRHFTLKPIDALNQIIKPNSDKLESLLNTVFEECHQQEAFGLGDRLKRFDGLAAFRECVVSTKEITINTSIALYSQPSETTISKSEFKTNVQQKVQAAIKAHHESLVETQQQLEEISKHKTETVNPTSDAAEPNASEPLRTFSYGPATAATATVAATVIGSGFFLYKGYEQLKDYKTNAQLITGIALTTLGLATAVAGVYTSYSLIS